MGKANDIASISHWFTDPRINLPIWAPKNLNVYSLANSRATSIRNGLLRMGQCYEESVARLYMLGQAPVMS